MDKLKKGLIGSILISVILAVTLTYVWATTPTTTFYISTGVYPGAPTYTIWIEGSGVTQAYYAKRYDGYIPTFSGSTNASYVINSALDTDLYGTVFLRNGLYSLDQPLTPSPSNTLTGEGYGKREKMATLQPSATFPDSEYMVKISGNMSGFVAGSIQKLWFFNPLFASLDVSGILLDAQTIGGVTAVLHNLLVRDCLFTYTYVGIHLRGWVWFSVFDNIKIIGENAAFHGKSAIWMEKGIGGGISPLEGPGLNCFNAIEIKGILGYETAIYFGNDTKYNKFSMVNIANINISKAGIAFEDCSFSNIIQVLRTGDLLQAGGGLSTVLFNGTRTFGNYIGLSQLSLINYGDVIRYINWPYNNYVQFDAHGALIYEHLPINGSQAGFNNVIELLPPHTDIAHSDETDPITYSGVSGNVTIHYWNGTIYRP